MKKNISFSFLKYLLLIWLCFLFLAPICVCGQTKLQQFDDQVLIDLSKTRTPEKTNFFLFISKHNTLVEVGVPTGLLLGGVLGNDKGMRQNAAYVASSSAVNFLFTMFLKKIIKRPRPFIANIKINAVYQPSHYSFPSGHSSSAFTTATALSQAYPKWYVIVPAYLWAGSIGYSRLYLGVHYPTDVAAGAILGSATAASMRFMRPD